MMMMKDLTAKSTPEAGRRLTRLCNSFIRVALPDEARDFIFLVQTHRSVQEGWRNPPYRYRKCLQKTHYKSHLQARHPISFYPNEASSTERWHSRRL